MSNKTFFFFFISFRIVENFSQCSKKCSGDSRVLHAQFLHKPSDDLFNLTWDECNRWQSIRNRVYIILASGDLTKSIYCFRRCSPRSSVRLWSNSKRVEDAILLFKFWTNWSLMRCLKFRWKLSLSTDLGLSQTLLKPFIFNQACITSSHSKFPSFDSM